MSNHSPNFIPFNKPLYFEESFNEAMKAASNYGQFSGDGINSKKCIQFFQTQYRYDRCLLTLSCTAALEMAAMILELGPGDEVTVPSFTFVTSANAFALRGANLVFADLEKDQPNVSVDDILKKVTEKTKAIVVVHYAGVPVDVSRILEETKNAITVVEDCAHAISSIDRKTGDYIGKLGCLSTFSFHETKNVGIGKGGLLVVNDEKLWRKAQIIREKGTNRTDFKAGRTSFYTWLDIGSSYLMSDIDAAMLWSLLQHVDQLQDSMLQIWNTYNREIDCPPEYIFKKPSQNLRANAQMYFLEFGNTKVCDNFCRMMMKDHNILVTPHFVPLDYSPSVKNMHEKQLFPPGEKCVQSEAWSKSLVRLPLFSDLQKSDQARVINAINNFIVTNTLHFQPVDECHWEAICQIRNNNCECFTNTAELKKEGHWNFMQKHHGMYCVAVQDGKVVGFIGSVDKDVCLATNLKGCGVAKFMWDSFIKEFGSDVEVKVLTNNPRSIGFFKKLGYVPDETLLNQGENPVPLVKVK